MIQLGHIDLWVMGRASQEAMVDSGSAVACDGLVALRLLAVPY